MALLMRTHNWSQTPLGAVETWPSSLKTAVSICLNSRFPMVIWWGKDLVLLYNDAWRSILGTKHPKALGRPGQAVWSEIWDIIGVQLHSVLETAQATWSNDMLLPVDRYGYTEEAYFTYSYSPIFLETGEVGGVFTAVTETTQRVIGERRLSTLRELAANTVEAKTVEETCRIASATLANNPYDISFALLYLVEQEGKQARLVQTVRIDTGTPASPEQVDLTQEEDCWTLIQVKKTGDPELVEELISRFGVLSGGAWDEPSRSGIVLPIAQAGQKEQLAGFLVLGISPRREFDDEYRGFFDLVASNVATAIANAQAYESERKRAEALAELDRAKTTFFSNVSHEFRTPLTLMLSPLEETLSRLDGQLPPVEREQLQMVQRNGLRLLKLVNTLLDFSRIEAGRVQAVYEPTDLAAFTTELASVFRAAIEQVGLRLVVDCPPLPELVYVDREMWEKIVLNLLSNAFKFTLEGEITISLRSCNAHIELIVRDTGTGIPAEELPYIFERFHRVKGARGRSYEGSGIGLSLVQELVRLHDGTIGVSSIVDRGTCFTVCIPAGCAHLPSEAISATRTLASTATGAMPYVEEISRWLPTSIKNVETRSADLSIAVAVHPREASLPTAHILLADDNADMRDYLKRLLSQQYDVEVVVDGVAALAAIRQQMPDLVLADVMMPRLDGFGLLQTLRADPQTQALPIILLSARAGEEARLEGLAAGADDYLTKPFSARELLARVEANLKLAQLRRDTAQREQASRLDAEVAYERVNQILTCMTDAFVAFDRDWRYTYANPASLQLLQKSSDELIGNNVWEVFPNEVGGIAYRELHRAMAEQVPVFWEELGEPVQRWLEVRAYPSTDGIAVYFQDITERKQTETALRQSEEKLRLAVTSARMVAWAWNASTDQIVRSETACEILGLSPETRNSSGTEGWNLAHPDDLPRHQANVADAIANRSSYISEFRVIRPDNGAVIWVQDRGQVTYDEQGNLFSIEGILFDITDRKQSEEALRQALQKLNFHVENTPMAVIEWDGALRIIRWAGAAEQIFGWSADEVLGRYIFDLQIIFEADIDHVAETSRQLMGVEPYVFSYNRNYTKQGDVIHCEWYNSSLRDEAGQMISVLSLVLDVTDRKQSEQALQQREAELKEAQRVGKFGNWYWDAKTDVSTGSDELLRIYGFDPAIDTMPNFTDQDGWLYPHESWQRINEAVQQTLETGIGYELDVQAFRNGTPIWVTTRSEVLRDSDGTIVGLRGTVQDISDRKQAEADLRSTEARYRLLAETIPQLVWITNAAGQNEYINQRFCEYTGLTSEELLDLGWLSIIHPDDLEMTRNCWLAAVHSGQFYEIEYRFRRVDGSYRWFLGQGIPLKDEQGRIHQWFGTCTDIEPQKQIEQARLRLLEQEQAARETAEQANRIKDEFLAVLSHELRTPMNPILGWAKLLRNGKLDAAKATQALETIDRNAQLQVQLIDDLLDISRILQGKLRLNSVPVPLSSVVSAALETVRLAAEAKAIVIQPVFSPSAPVVNGDTGRLQQVVWNLLSNAVKFTPSGGQIEVEVFQAGTNAQIRVKDNGKGIKPEFLPYVFEHFRQEDGATTRKFGGLGLGLSISRQIVELHGGQISVESLGEGQGATFIVQIPLASEFNQISASEQSIAFAPNLSGLQILVVDDEPDSREFVAFVLEQAGAIVTCLSSGIEALQKMEQLAFDLIVSDIGMPEMDGYMLMQQIRSLEQHSQVRAIALTAYAREIDYQQAMSAGFQQHITKPVEPAVLVQAISRLVQQSQ